MHVYGWHTQNGNITSRFIITISLHMMVNIACSLVQHLQVNLVGSVNDCAHTFWQWVKFAIPSSYCHIRSCQVNYLLAACMALIIEHSEVIGQCKELILPDGEVIKRPQGGMMKEIRPAHSKEWTACTYESWVWALSHTCNTATYRSSCCQVWLLHNSTLWYHSLHLS